MLRLGASDSPEAMMTRYNLARGITLLMEVEDQPINDGWFFLFVVLPWCRYVAKNSGTLCFLIYVMGA